MRNALLPLGLFTCLWVQAQPPTAPAQVMYERALEQARSGELDSAWSNTERALSLVPTHAKALKLRGDLNQRKGQVEAALQDYKQSESIDPNNARLFVSRGALRISQGMHKSALKDCERAIELDPTDPDGFYNRACALYLGGNTEAAKKDAQKAVRLKPDHADALYLSGVTKGELYEEEDGMADIDAALRLKPEIPGGLMSMGILLYEAKRYEEAIDKFTQVIGKDTAELAAAYYYRGDSWYHMENKDNACADFKQSLLLGDKDALFIKKNYCDTDLSKIPKKPVKKRRLTVEF